MCLLLIWWGSVFVATIIVMPLQGDDYPALHKTLDCSFNGTTINHGKVAATFVENCLQFVCNNGSITTRTHGDPGCSHCCEFNNHLYSEGEQQTGHCLVLTCTGGSWTLNSTIDNCCRHCCLHDDLRFDWHGTCYYSVAQVGNIFDPPAGVFSDFDDYGMASCLSLTSFKDNSHTLISLDTSVYEIIVNGDSYVVPLTGIHADFLSRKHPLLVWSYNHCIVLIGSSKFVPFLG